MPRAGVDCFMTTVAVSPTVSVIVPVHHAGPEFRHCLDSLTRAAPVPCEIIIVADGQAAGNGKMAHPAGVSILTLPVTGGPARARNHGAAAARGDILLFIDSDVTVRSDIISKITTIFTTNPDL